MQWSGPNIQVPLCVCNKNEKKLNYLGKPHERFWFGTLFYVNGLFREKSNLQHRQHRQITILTVLRFSSRSLVVFLTQIFQQVFCCKLSVGFRFLSFEVSVFIKKRFYFKIQQFCFGLFLPDTRFFLPIGAVSQERTM